MLDQIDEFLTGDNQKAAVELWDVLTALRGPDADCEHVTSSERQAFSGVKDQTTVPVRRAAFPKTADARYPYSRVSEQRASFGIQSEAKYKGIVERRYDGTIRDGHMKHFDVHGARAAVALGLIKAVEEVKQDGAGQSSGS